MLMDFFFPIISSNHKLNVMSFKHIDIAVLRSLKMFQFPLVIGSRTSAFTQTALCHIVLHFHFSQGASEMWESDIVRGRDLMRYALPWAADFLHEGSQLISPWEDWIRRVTLFRWELFRSRSSDGPPCRDVHCASTWCGSSWSLARLTLSRDSSRAAFNLNLSKDIDTLFTNLHMSTLTWNKRPVFHCLYFWQLGHSCRL